MEQLIVTKHESVLDDVRDGGGQAVFIGSKEEAEPGIQPMFVTMDKGTWEDMGSPDVVTVSVVPGDMLNIPVESMTVTFGGDVERWLGDAFVSWLPSSRGLLFRDRARKERRVPFGAVIHKDELGNVWAND